MNRFQLATYLRLVIINVEHAHSDLTKIRVFRVCGQHAKLVLLALFVIQLALQINLAHSVDSKLVCNCCCEKKADKKEQAVAELQVRVSQRTKGVVVVLLLNFSPRFSSEDILPISSSCSSCCCQR